MAYVVTESCIKCRYTDCVDVCPVECFHAGPNFLVIDPETCIDCDVCVPTCPVDAIMPEQQVPADQRRFIALNAELAQVWPVLSDSQAPPPDADHWARVSQKRHLLER